MHRHPKVYKNTPTIGCDITPMGCDITPQQRGVRVHPNSGMFVYTQRALLDTLQLGCKYYSPSGGAFLYTQKVDMNTTIDSSDLGVALHPLILTTSLRPIPSQEDVVGPLLAIVVCIIGPTL